MEKIGSIRFLHYKMEAKKIFYIEEYTDKSEIIKEMKWGYGAWCANHVKACMCIRDSVVTIDDWYNTINKWLKNQRIDFQLKVTNG